MVLQNIDILKMQTKLGHAIDYTLITFMVINQVSTNFLELRKRILQLKNVWMIRKYKKQLAIIMEAKNCGKVAIV